MTRPSDRRPGQDGGGWRAFVLGMVGMFAVIAVWVALVESTGEREVDERRPTERPASEIVQLGEVQAPDGPISDYR
ncbi:MAG: hypothetical protein ACT6R7_00625 [Brevundimonas aurantiaca]|uniref:Uncharacterized protein n=1 Tax=Brevundimonas aurantiaca TaxID=74316 RepID=A0A7W9C539_9CAUL|nr:MULTISPECIES: hypothetical protein [Brevundimonas]MBB5739190.1 hypothetical protein [Brevundimonas aurantiaca]MEC7798277.1 hypothetical protein [Pseudomonadota bacterium]MED5536308.1 hypothetical protein [Pseudomonadota bacterium]